MKKIARPAPVAPAPNYSFADGDAAERKRQMERRILDQPDFKEENHDAAIEFICSLLRLFNPNDHEIVEAVNKRVIPVSPPQSLGQKIRNWTNTARKQVLSALIPEYNRLKSEHDLLKRSRKRDGRPIPPINTDEEPKQREDHRQSNDSVALFLSATGYRPSTTTYKSRTEFLKEYMAFCHAKKCVPENRNTFYDLCRDAGFVMKKKRNYVIYAEK